MTGVGQCRFLITILALQVHGDLLHHAPWLVVQFLGPTSLIETKKEFGM